MTHHPYLGTAGCDLSTRDGYGHTADEQIDVEPELDPKAVAVWVALIFGSLLALAISLKLIIWVAYSVWSWFA